MSLFLKKILSVSYLLFLWGMAYAATYYEQKEHKTYVEDIVFGDTDKDSYRVYPGASRTFGNGVDAMTCTYKDNLTIIGDVIVKSGSTLVVDGSLVIGRASLNYVYHYGTLTIEEGATLIVTGDMTMNYPENIAYISSASRNYIQGNLTNSGTINCNGRLVVGTESEGPDGTTVITSNGTITNLGTININTSDAALVKTQQEPILENSVYYAAVTCANMVNGRYTDSPLNANDKGVINMYDGSLIVQKDLTLWYRSKFYFKKGQYYIDVWGDLIQYDKYYTRTEDDAIIKLDGVGAKAEINVKIGRAHV